MLVHESSSLLAGGPAPMRRVIALKEKMLHHLERGHDAATFGALTRPSGPIAAR